MQRQYMSRFAARRGIDSSRRSRMDTEETGTVFREEKRITVDISLNTILLILGTLVAILLSAKLIEIVALVFFAFIISSAALPAVRWFMEKGLSRGLAIFFTYLFGLSLVIGSFLLIFVPFFNELQYFVLNFPSIGRDFVDRISQVSLSGYSINPDAIRHGVNDLANWMASTFASSDGLGGLVGTAINVGSGFLSIITAILLSVYIIVDHDNFVDLMLLRIIDDHKRRRVRQLVFDVEEKLGGWLLGQTTLSFVIGVMVWLFLTLVGVPFALPLAVLAALLESIPSLGPTLSAIPAILVALLAMNPFTAVIVTIGYMIIQQLENTLIVPRIMANAVGLKPIIVIVSVATGFTLAGPIGALLSVPVAVLLQIAYEFYIDLQKLRAKGIV
jgi:predicted PurR-regulated permease PerM